MEIKTTWTDLKALVTAKTLNFQYRDDSANYYVFAQEGVVVYSTVIKKESPANSDQTDFEANYKPTANAGLQALPVSGTFSFTPAKYKPALAQSITEFSLSSSDQTLLSVTAEGQVDYIYFRFSKKEVDLGVFVDGVEAYRIDLEVFKDDLELESGLEKGSPIGVDDGGKMFMERFIPPVDFATSFEIKAKKVSSSPKFSAGLIKYRIKI